MFSDLICVLSSYHDSTKESLVGSIGDQDLLLGVDRRLEVQQVRVHLRQRVDKTRMALMKKNGRNVTELEQEQMINCREQNNVIRNNRII